MFNDFVENNHIFNNVIYWYVKRRFFIFMILKQVDEWTKNENYRVINIKDFDWIMHFVWFAFIDIFAFTIKWMFLILKKKICNYKNCFFWPFAIIIYEWLLNLSFNFDWSSNTIIKNRKRTFNLLHYDIFNVINFRSARLSIKEKTYDNLSAIAQFFLKSIFMID